MDEESGQILLSGMGEFHLEIAGDRLINDFKIKATMGKIAVAYRESILVSSTPQSYTFDKQTAGKRGKASCIAAVSRHFGTASQVEPTDEYTVSIAQDGNTIRTTITNLSSSDPDAPYDFPDHLSASIVHTSLLNGALAALGRGSGHSLPCYGIHVSLTLDLTADIFGTDTTPAAVSSAARLATRAALKESTERAGSALLELVMNVTISVDQAKLGEVSRDISSTRGGQIVLLNDAAETGTELPPIDLRRVYCPPDPFATSTVETGNGAEVTSGARQGKIVARVPLKEMVGYLKHLRRLTGGRATFVMSADRFERVVGQREKVLLKELKAF